MKFRLIDRLLVFESGRRLVCRKSVSFEEYQLPTRVAQSEHLPASLMLQSAFEGIHWLIVLSSGFQEGWIPEGVERVEFKGTLRPGESIQIEVQPAVAPNLFSVIGRVDQRIVLEVCHASGHRVPLSDLLDPHDMQTLTAEIAVPDVRTAAGITIQPA